MSDPLSPPSLRATEPRDAADREARIEELLLLGLDHYFASQYERAISVWTRIIFLDRHHDRARAYIERARGALAERQRESDEFLHHGLVAYNAGEIDRARDLLTRAVEQGSDAADVFLNRLNQVGPAGTAVDVHPGVLPPRATAPRRQDPRRPRQRRWAAAVVIGLAVAASALVGGVPLGTWISDLQVTRPARTSRPVAEEALPLLRSSEAALARARSLYAGGHLRDAVRALDRVGLADPLRSEADRLRADIQRDLLAAAGLAGRRGVQP